MTSWYNHITPHNDSISLRWTKNRKLTLIYRLVYVISWVTHFIYLHTTTEPQREEVKDIWWWKFAFLTKWGEMLCVAYSIISFWLVFKKSLTSKCACVIQISSTALAIGITFMYIFVLGKYRKYWKYYNTYRDVYWHQLNTVITVLDVVLSSTPVYFASLLAMQLIGAIYLFVNWLVWYDTGIAVYPTIKWKGERLKYTIGLFFGMQLVGLPMLYFVVLGTVKLRDNIWANFAQDKSNKDHEQQALK